MLSSGISGCTRDRAQSNDARFDKFNMPCSLTDANVDHSILPGSG